MLRTETGGGYYTSGPRFSFILSGFLAAEGVSTGRFPHARVGKSRGDCALCCSSTFKNRNRNLLLKLRRRFLRQELRCEFHCLSSSRYLQDEKIIICFQARCQECGEFTPPPFAESQAYLILASRKTPRTTSRENSEKTPVPGRLPSTGATVSAWSRRRPDAARAEGGKSFPLPASRGTPANNNPDGPRRKYRTHSRFRAARRGFFRLI